LDTVRAHWLFAGHEGIGVVDLLRKAERPREESQYGGHGGGLRSNVPSIAKHRTLTLGNFRRALEAEENGFYATTQFPSWKMKKRFWKG